MDVVRFNTERSPQWSLSVTPGKSWQVGSAVRRLVSDDCIGVWWRRPEVPIPPLGTGSAGETVADQWFAFLAALVTVPGPVWVSDPARIRRAENKALQLRVAEDMGLRTPQTIWTNDVEVARAFLEGNGEAIVKSVASAWWEAAGTGYFVFAGPVEPSSLPERTRLASAPVCFQQRIEPKRDIRVTVIGDSVLAAERRPRAADNEPLDWRLATPADWTPYELPAGVSDGCRDVVQALGLRFGGIDLAAGDDGQHWFLELNPNGEWGWLQTSGLPIAEALADTLTSRDERVCEPQFA